MIENLNISQEAFEGVVVVSAGLAATAVAGLASKFPFLVRFAKASRDIQREQQVALFEDEARVVRSNQARADASARLVVWKRENGLPND